MTTIHDARLITPLQQQHAALTGALLAFSGAEQPSQPLRYNLDSRPQSQAPRGRIVSSPVSRRETPSPVLSMPSRPQSATRAPAWTNPSSNIAAATAAARFADRSGLGLASRPASRPATTRAGTLGIELRQDGEDGRDAVPETGTVRGLRGRFEAEQATHQSKAPPQQIVITPESTGDVPEIHRQSPTPRPASQTPPDIAFENAGVRASHAAFQSAAQSAASRAAASRPHSLTKIPSRDQPLLRRDTEHSRSSTLSRESRDGGFRSRAATDTPTLRGRRPIPTTSREQSKAREDEEAARIDALANAIVSAHLASRVSSRTASPAKKPPPPPPRRHTEGGLFPNRHHRSRTPSPSKKVMPHTLREAPEEEAKPNSVYQRQRSHFHLRQHPNKHHEGDRKRWRDEITLEERKRYEGVWAANKNVHLALTPEELQSPKVADDAKSSVSFVVVRDIWSRSRLPLDILAEIWDLVDTTRLGRLGRESFVVGLWLIDQSLKGRKPPPRVGESVWASVRGFGVKVPKPKG